MPYRDCFILIGMGCLFILLGLAMIFCEKSREKKYYDSLHTRIDVREYLNHWPPSPGRGAIKIGGWIAIAIGLFMISMGGAFWLRGEVL